MNWTVPTSVYHITVVKMQDEAHIRFLRCGYGISSPGMKEGRAQA
jgi:hypothetical protein